MNALFSFISHCKRSLSPALLKAWQTENTERGASTSALDPLSACDGWHLLRVVSPTALLIVLRIFQAESHLCVLKLLLARVQCCMSLCQHEGQGQCGLGVVVGGLKPSFIKSLYRDAVNQEVGRFDWRLKVQFPSRGRVNETAIVSEVLQKQKTVWYSPVSVFSFRSSFYQNFGNL